MAKNNTVRVKKWKKRQLPSKKTVNLAIVDVEQISLTAAVFGIILIIAAAVLFGKFAVSDRLAAVSGLREEELSLKKQVEEASDKLKEYGDIQETYAHYTYEGLTKKEKNRADRMDAINLLEEIVLPKAIVERWSISENRIVLPIEGATLQQINLLVQELQEQEIVSYCNVSTASSGDNIRGDSFAPEDETEPDIFEEIDETEEFEDTDLMMPDTVVTAQVTIYLNSPLQEKQTGGDEQ